MTTRTFETVTCTRCNGTGRYSFNLKDGNTCYGCGGKGVKHTKRALMADAWMTDKRTIKASKIAIGQRIHLAGVYPVSKRFAITVAKIERSVCAVNGNSFINVTSVNGNEYVINAALNIKIALSEDNHKALYELALEYQDSL